MLEGPLEIHTNEDENTIRRRAPPPFSHLLTLLLECGLELLRQVLVHGRADPVHVLNDRNARPKPRPNRPHLESDDAPTNDRHLLRDRADVQGPRRVDDAPDLVVDRHGGERRDLGPSSEDDALSL